MKVGDYVRYKYENCIYIGKIKFVSEVMGYEETLQLDIDNCMEEILKEDIIKSSPNIIDLIEVGDILYLKESDDVACMFFKDIYLVKNDDNLLNIISDIMNKKCKLISIVTKEQFERMEYEVK